MCLFSVNKHPSISSMISETDSPADSPGIPTVEVHPADEDEADEVRKVKDINELPPVRPPGGRSAASIEKDQTS